MSSALVRQALAFVESEESVQKKRQAKAARPQATIVQDFHHPYRRKIKKAAKKSKKSEEELVEENIKKLLALSEPVADKSIAEKIVERAVRRKPLAEKIEIKTKEEKSILFPEESFESFEKEYFCS